MCGESKGRGEKSRDQYNTQKLAENSDTIFSSSFIRSAHNGVQRLHNV